MTNVEFKKRHLARMANEYDLPVGLITTHQASKFRRKMGTFYNLWREAKRAEGRN